MSAADCANVGLFWRAICCSSSSVIVFCSEAGVCARPGRVVRNKVTERQSANRVTQRSRAIVSTLTFVSSERAIRLFMFVLHSWHIHLHWLIAFLLFSKLHNLFVLLGRQHAHEGHHSRHEAAP